MGKHAIGLYSGGIFQLIKIRDLKEMENKILKMI